MHNSNSFDHLIQKALQTNDFPPIPASILQKWQPKRLESGAKWLWILPSVVFVLGIFVGVWLAPLGLENAFVSLKLSLSAIWNLIPSAALSWALALVITMVVLSFDGLKSVFLRLK
ncbi:MAG: hypothetical protein KA902_03195 [Arenimonas sp.]|nr:hypothetical protein [Arenimonas sp.]